jgi:hypothetical protein
VAWALRAPRLRISPGYRFWGVPILRPAASANHEAMTLAELSNEDLIRWHCMRGPTDEGTSVLQDDVAEEIERRGLDV